MRHYDICGAPFGELPAALGVVSVAPAGPRSIWLDRDYEPFVSLNLANVALNSAPAGPDIYAGKW